MRKIKNAAKAQDLRDSFAGMIRQALLLKARPSLLLSQACRMAHSVVAGSATAPELLKVVAAAHFGGQKVAVSVDGS